MLSESLPPLRRMATVCGGDRFEFVQEQANEFLGLLLVMDVERSGRLSYEQWARGVLTLPEVLSCFHLPVPAGVASSKAAADGRVGGGGGPGSVGGKGGGLVAGRTVERARTVPTASLRDALTPAPWTAADTPASGPRTTATEPDALRALQWRRSWRAVAGIMCANCAAAPAR